MDEKNLKEKVPFSKYRIYLLGIFSIMFFLLWKQFGVVHIYFDDYAYYSLSYAPSYSATRDFTLPQLLTFMKAHYMECNGRLFYFFVWLFLYWLGGLNLVQFAAAIVLTGTLYTLWMAVSVHLPVQNKIFAAIGICVMYWLLDVVFLNQGIYWFAAFFSYVTPVWCLTGASLLYFGKYLKNQKRRTWTVMILIFLAGWSQEQQAASTVVFASMLTLWGIIFKKEKRVSLSCVLPSIIALGIVLMSPGIQERVQLSGGGTATLKSVLANMRTAIYILGTASSWRINATIFSFMVLLSVLNFKAAKHTYARYLWLAQAVIQCVMVYFYLFERQRVELFVSGVQSPLNLWAGVLLLAGIFANVVVFEFREKNYEFLTIFIAAFISIAVLIIVPQIPNRLAIFFTLTMIAGCGQIFAYCISDKNFHIRHMSRALMIVVLIVAIKNGMTIHWGYSENYRVLVRNDERLRYAADEMLTEGETIILEKIPQPLYCCVTPEDEAYQILLKIYMDSYYGLPKGTRYQYVNRIGNPL